MFEIDARNQNSPKKPEVAIGFLGGLNTFQDENLLRDNELTKAKNIILSVDGLEPRPGVVNYGNDGGDSIVYGSLGAYKSTGTREFLRISGGRLKKLSGGAWSQVGATAYSSVPAVLLQARDKVFIFNGSDNLSYYDFSTITTYTSLSTPGAPTVTPTGTAGTTAYSYKISAFNTVGETLAGSAGTTATGNATLDTTNYNSLSWSSVASATGYNVWGRKATGLGETYMTTVYTTTYKDQGQDEPSLSILPPEGNSTQGIKCAFACFAISRIFAAGDPDNPSRLYYGGVANNIGNFSGAEEGGGNVDIFKNDGAIIRGIAPFQGGVIVWKDNAIYKFSFNSATGFPQLEEITRSFGGISHRAIKAVENDIVFPAKKDGRLAFYSLGNQENYSSAVLRTNELSIKIAPSLTDVNVSKLNRTSAFYFNDIYGVAVATASSTTNNRIWCLDTRFGAWVHWDDLDPNHFTTYIDTDESEYLYMGSETTGYMRKMFQDSKNDNGSAISVQWATKSFNQKLFQKVKNFFWPTFQFKDVSIAGGIEGDIILDGAVVEATFTINVASSGGAGIGAMLMGGFLAGDAFGGTLSDTEASDIPVEIRNRFQARSIKYEFRSDTVNADYKFLSLAHEVQILNSKRIDSGYRTYAQ